MKVGSKRMGLAAAVMTVVWLIGVALAASGPKLSPGSSAVAGASQPAASGRLVSITDADGHTFSFQAAQAAAPQGAMMAEAAFKNIQVLRGIPVDDFMQTMGIMSAALSLCCSECHTGAGTDTVRWEDDTPRKRTARRMVEMVTALNKANFGGRQVVTCWTCHRGRDIPVVTPALDTVYGEAVLEDDDFLTRAPGGPTPDQVLDKYIAAIGGAQRLATLTSFDAKGTSVGFGGFGGGGEVEIFARAPDQRATYIHFEDPERGDSTRTFDGRTGWIRTPLTVLNEYQITGGDLDGARLDAQLSFPGQIKSILTNMRVSSPTIINDRVVEVLQGNGPRGLVATLYFDRETSLLVRVVRLTPSPIGRVPVQVDYSDYRDVNGIRMPFRWVFAWLDGRDAFELKDVQLNVPIDAAKFGRPPSPPAAAR